LTAAGDEVRLAYLMKHASIRRKALKASLFFASIYFISIALANPRAGYEVEEVERKGLDIVFALDVSKSMLCEDVVPNRIERAKQLIRNILEELSTDRVGMVIYAGSAFPQLPITTDYTMARMLLDHVSTDMVSSQGTALKDALELAEGFFEDSGNASKVVVVISDGENHEEGAMEIANDLKDEDFTLFTVGVGSNAGGPIPEKRGSRLIGYKKDQQGKVIITKLDAGQLKEIAQTGGGKYYDMSRSSAQVADLMTEVNALERAAYENIELRNYKDQFQWFLALGLILLLVEELIAERKWTRKTTKY
jgi:Ca-activated chloride channel family protein